MRAFWAAVSVEKGGSGGRSMASSPSILLPSPAMKNADGGTVQRPHIMRRRAFKTRVHLTFVRSILGPLYLKKAVVIATVTETFRLVPALSTCSAGTALTRLPLGRHGSPQVTLPR